MERRMMKRKIITTATNHWRRIKRERWLKRLRKKNQNHSFSLISNDCVGGVIYHDLGEQFRSPTVNLWIPNSQFLEFAQNLKYYLSCEIKETPDAAKSYPVGTIIPKDDQHIPIEVNFMHYPSFEAGYEKWKERSARVDYDNLYYIWHFFDDDDNTERLKLFDCWNVRKLSILHKPISGICNCEVTNCYNQDPHDGKILDVVPKTGKRYLDEIDYIGFLNRKG